MYGHRRWFFALGGAGTLLSVPDLSDSSLSELLSSENLGAIVLKIFCSLWRYILYIRLHRILVYFFDERPPCAHFLLGRRSERLCRRLVPFTFEK